MYKVLSGGLWAVPLRLAIGLGIGLAGLGAGWGPAVVPEVEGCWGGGSLLKSGKGRLRLWQVMGGKTNSGLAAWSDTHQLSIGSVNMGKILTFRS